MNNYNENNQNIKEFLAEDIKEIEKFRKSLQDNDLTKKAKEITEKYKTQILNIKYKSKKDENIDDVENDEDEYESRMKRVRILMTKCLKELVKINMFEDKRILKDRDIARFWIERTKKIKIANKLTKVTYFKITDDKAIKMIIDDVCKYISNGEIMTPKQVDNILRLFQSYYKTYEPTVQNDTDTRNYNTFKPTEFILYEPNNRIEIDKLIELLEELPTVKILLDNLFIDKKVLKHWINQTSFTFNTLEKIDFTNVFGYFQGSGKNVLFDYIYKLFYGADNCIMVGNQQIENQFNTIFMDRLFIMINEANQGQVKDRNKTNDVIKSYISEHTILINTKHITEFEVPNYFNVMISTNHRNGVVIETTDRRNTVIETREKNLKNAILDNGFNVKNYFNQLREEAELFIILIKKLNYNEELARSTFDTKAKEDLRDLTNNKKDLLSHRLKMQDYQWFEEQIIDKIIGVGEEYQFYKFKAGDKDKKEFFTTTNNGMLKVLKTEISQSVISKITLDWIYRILIEEDAPIPHKYFILGGGEQRTIRGQKIRIFPLTKKANIEPKLTILNLEINNPFYKKTKEDWIREAEELF